MNTPQSFKFLVLASNGNKDRAYRIDFDMEDILGLFKFTNHITIAEFHSIGLDNLKGDSYEYTVGVVISSL